VQPGDIESLSHHPSIELALGTQSGRAYSLIRARILCLDLAPGALISERVLMEDTGLGRTPVREALLRLAMERLVVSAPGHRLTVSPIGLNEVRDIYEVRLQEDRLAGRLCLSNASSEHLQAIAKCFDGAEDHIGRGEHSAVFNMDFRFHALFYKGAGNAVLSASHHLLLGHYYRFAQISLARRPEARTRDGMRALVTSHTDMIDAVVRRDAEALDAAIITHTTNSLANFVAILTGLRMTTIAGLKMQ
jgi:DNA-binding GntR family transcriptional regulator